MRVATEYKGCITAPAPPDIACTPCDLALEICDGLVDHGHEVDFYAVEGSQTRKSKLVTLGQTALASNYDEGMSLLSNPGLHAANTLALADQYYSAEMFRRAKKGMYDLLHFHRPEVALPYVADYPMVPVIYTLHDPIDELQRTTLERYLTANQFFVSLSNFQRLSAPELPYIATVYNGIDPSLFTLDPDIKRSDRLLFVGRIVPDKGVKEAVAVALASGNGLDIIGPVTPDNQSYFDTNIAPYLNDQIRYLGHIPRRLLTPYYQHAKAFLMPIQWDETFGLTAAEANACGASVIALRRGSMPEVIDHERTGFVVDTLDDMVEAIANVSDISPTACRNRVLAKFTIELMVRGYEAAFRSAIARVIDQT